MTSLEAKMLIFNRLLSLVLLNIALLAITAPLNAAEPHKGPPPQIAEIDRMVKAVWDEYDLRPSSQATDGEWCRRVYLDLIGRIPSATELTEFVGERSRNKRAALVSKLLNDDEYTEEYSRNWTTLWSNQLIGRTGGRGNRSLISRSGMQKYLRDTFARNKPYDKMVHELIAATGNTAPGTPNFNGATNFLVMKVNEEKASVATAATSRIFLGLQVQCAQCHNHPFNEWKQETYWKMNAFFRQTKAKQNFQSGTRDVASADLVNQDFHGEGPKSIRRIDNALVYFELRNGVVQTALPTFITGEKIGTSGHVEKVNRRQELARLITNSEYLEKSAVNRMWAHFLGYGFTKPIDDMGPHNLPSHPELLDYLAKEFRKSGFDNKQLIEWITLSKAYGLSSKTIKRNSSDDPMLGESPKFSHFYLRQMRAEELYQSLVTATEAEKGMSIDKQEQFRNRWLQQFATAFGTDEGDETTSFNGTIPQALMMFNGELVKRSVNDTDSGLFAEIVSNNDMHYEAKIDRLFLAGVGRKASRKFLTGAHGLLASYKNDEQKALQDIWWAVLNSNEFIFNH